jgi:hypothetical protein
MVHSNEKEREAKNNIEYNDEHIIMTSYRFVRRNKHWTVWC